MKKAVTAFVLIAFAGAVAFASFETSKKQNKQQQQKQEKKEIKKKKSCSHTCLFS
jgi:flagellar biosynthesis component FlhA